MDVITFNQRVKHGTLDFHPGVNYGFEDPDAAPYFKACGWALDVPNGEPQVTISIGELDIDPLTIWGHDHGPDQKRGQFVMPERVAAHLNADIEKVKAFQPASIEKAAFDAQVDAELRDTANA